MIKGKIIWQKLNFDIELAVLLLALLATGTSFIFSSSSIYARNEYGNMMYFFNRHLVFLFLGVVVLIVVSKIRYQSLRGYIPLLNLVAAVFNLMVAFNISSVTVNGATRWLNLFGFTFQPSEFAKIVLILTLGHLIDKKRRMGLLNDFKQGIVPIALYSGFLIGLVFLQNHLSATGVLVFIMACMLIVAGIRKIYLFIAGVAVLALGVIAVVATSFRLGRIFAFLDPYQDPLGTGFQVIQSWRALAGGGLTGLGLGMSRQKFGWLPESHTDFILSIIGEEIGFIGILFLFIIFLWFLTRGLFIANSAPDFYGKIIGTGIVSMLFFQIAINISVVTGMFPPTGMPLPFVSYGGTSTIMLMGAVGILLNIASQIKERKN